MQDRVLHATALVGMFIGFLMATVLHWGWGDFALLFTIILLLDYLAPRLVALARGEVQDIRGFLRGA